MTPTSRGFSPVSAQLLQFEDFELDRNAYQLRRGASVVHLERIPLELLFLLVDKRGELVSREEILERIWGKGVFIDAENSINAAVRKVRRALNDDAESPRFVVRVHAKGYRFTASVREQTAVPVRPSPVRLPGSSFVGRERESAELDAGLSDASVGRGRLFLISGEPGIGKSRLSTEVANLAVANHMTVLIGHCSEQAEAVPYLPFVEILESCVDRASSPDAVSKLVGDEAPELARLLPKLRRILPEIPPPLELPPSSARRNLFNCFFDFIGRLSKQRPTLLILEDLHWAEESTLAMLNHLVHRLSDLPVLLVGTYRHADLDLSGGFKKTLEDLLRDRLAHPITLKGLSRDQAAEMLASLSGKTPPAAVVSEIYRQTAGNPFFLEELFLHLKEEDRLFDSAGEFRAELKIGEIEAPRSVRLVVGLRLARLSERTREILAAAAVIGRTFAFDLLEASIAGDSEGLLECVEEAEKAGLIVSSDEKPQFEFSHELIRQAVLGGISSGRRQRFHLDVAGAMERMYSQSVEEHSAELAHHYRLGGNVGKAILYLLPAAKQSFKRSAYQEAISLAASALKLLNAMPSEEQSDRHEIELELQLVIGSAHATTHWAAPEAERAFARALELCQRLDQTPAAIRAMTQLHTHYLNRAQYERAAAIQTQLLEIAIKFAQPDVLAEIHQTVGVMRLYHGDFEAAKQQLEIAVQHGAGPWAAIARPGLALAMWNLGYPDQASKLIRDPSSERRARPNPFVDAIIADFSSMVHAMSKDAAAAKAHASTITMIATEYRFASEITSANMIHGWANACEGDPNGIDVLRDAMREWEDSGLQLGRPWAFGALAEVCLKFGRIDEAAAALDAAMAFVARTGEGFAESEIYRLKGEVELRVGRSHLGGAARWFEQAIDVARKRSAKIAELRATVSLARMLARQGKQKKARTMLAEIYGWFTEGFDTADLKDAKALLDELRE